MRATPIDPRDQTAEVNAPTFRVYFWTEDGSSDEWELSETDLDEVLEWIPTASRGRSHSLWAVMKYPGEVIHVRLRGIDLDVPDPGRVYPVWARREYR